MMDSDQVVSRGPSTAGRPSTVGLRIRMTTAHDTTRRHQASSRPCDGVLGAVGATPLAALTRLFRPSPCNVFAKLEGLNPGGSIKDRPAAAIVDAAIREGTVVPGQTALIESSSGNFAIGLAQACKFHGVELVCVVDPKTPKASIAVLRAFGARLEMVGQPDVVTGEYLPARLRRVQELLAQLPHTFWPNQYGSLIGARAHLRTMYEICEALDGKVDYLLCATSTCATLRGCSEFIAEHHMTTKVVAVDAVGSVIFGTPAGFRLIPGHGAAVRPALYADNLAHVVVHVTDFDCVSGCRRLLDTEAYLAGGSSGAVVAALERMRPELRSDDNCVLILADRGERYLNTIYNDSWVEEHFAGERPAWCT